LFVVIAVLGIGNGAVLQLVPNRFPKEIGVMTRLIGAPGGWGICLAQRPWHPEAGQRQLQRWLARVRACRGFGGAAALAYASRGWQGILIGRRDLTLEGA
jgi:NNP family nitrate/nitrite transporter-like MFS transporter